jgi:hypothetical protein
MSIWALHPVDLMDPSWKASTYRGNAIVRASNERMARETAERAFGVIKRYKSGEGAITPPWGRPDLVKVEMVWTSTYDPEGAATVLYPAD